jgi:malonyl-CoA O-methyltransferase
MQNSIDNNYAFDINNVRNAFNEAARHYDQHCVLQNTVAERLIESFEQIKIKPLSILDLGTGTGQATKQLKQQFKSSQLYQADLSEEMLKNARRKSSRFFSRNHYLCADASQLPLESNKFELVFSNLMLQWCIDLDSVFAEINRVLKPGGVFVFTSFGPDTLKELRECWQQVDSDVHVNVFTDMHDLGDGLVRKGMDAPVLSTEEIVLTYDECKQLMRDLKNIGAHNVNEGRRKSLTGKQRLQKVINHYELFRQDNKLPATYEVIYGHAWKPESDKKSKASNVQQVSLDELKQSLNKRKK